MIAYFRHCMDVYFDAGQPNRESCQIWQKLTRKPSMKEVLEDRPSRFPIQTLRYRIVPNQLHQDGRLDEEPNAVES